MNSLASQDRNFSVGISKWYLSLGRNNLPWRKNVSPYRVWISEIMLQQTQVKTVVPFFEKFIRKYPNLKSISTASEEEILALWSGLGFYRRAKNIFKTKEIIKKDFKNRFPKNFEELILLPGIGKSTAGAIMSIAYQKPYPILDANVKRVISRYKNIDLNNKDSIKKLWLLSKELTPEKNIFEYTQGIMDLGATICSTRSPTCINCPISKSCINSFNDFEMKVKAKKKRPKKKISFVLAHSNNTFLLFKKNENSFWQSLWTPYDKDRIGKNNFFKQPVKRKKINFNHLLSHLELDITVEKVEYKRPFKIQTNLEHKWINKDSIHNYGLPKPIKTIIENHG